MEITDEKLLILMNNFKEKIAPLEIRFKMLNSLLDQGQEWNKDQVSALKEQTFLKKVLDDYEEFSSTFEFFKEVWWEMKEKETLARELEEFFLKVEKYMIFLLFSKEERGDCYLEVQSGTGGADAENLTLTLFSMYKGWAGRTGRSYTIIDYATTDNGLRNGVLKIEGENTYGFLGLERGIHRVVRYSPFNKLDKRQTSFIGVEVYPVVEENQLVLEEKDLVFEFCRSSGAGGQHVNKTESAVRVTHKPTGLVVRCENERSRHSNQQTAIKLLKIKLIARERALKLKKETQNQLDRPNISWGQQIRSYTFNPYQLIKDLRSGYETSNLEKFLSGELLDDCLYENLMKLKVK